jgi:hypothetical protein
MNLIKHLWIAPELAQLCTQNGWIDNDSMNVEVLEQTPDHVVAAVTFEEIVMEGAGCIATRQPCYGRVRAHLGKQGEITGLEVL